MGRKKSHHRKSDSDDGPSVVVLNRQRAHRLDRQRLARFARQVLDTIGESGSSATVTFVSDRTMRPLNRVYRGLDRSTDVLSFSYEPDFAHEEEIFRYLGDVVISTGTAARYAAKRGVSFNRELKNLIIHGLLHLCGYDHETDHGEMKQLERRLRRRLIPLGL
jgi:probable rRNA maturation factor